MSALSGLNRAPTDEVPTPQVSPPPQSEEPAGEEGEEDDSLPSNKAFWLHFRNVTRVFSFYACGRISAAEGKGAGRLVTLQLSRGKNHAK